MQKQKFSDQARRVESNWYTTLSGIGQKVTFSNGHYTFLPL